MNLRKSCKAAIIALSALMLSGFYFGDAFAGSVSILNCTHDNYLVGAYNSNDPVMMIAYKDACIHGYSKSASLSCATLACKIKVWQNTCIGGPTGFKTSGAVSGHWFLAGSNMYSMTDTAAQMVKLGMVPAGTKTLSCSQILTAPASAFQ